MNKYHNYMKNEKFNTTTMTTHTYIVEDYMKETKIKKKLPNNREKFSH